MPLTSTTPSNAQAERNFVGDQLGAGAQPAQKAVFVVAGPAAEDHAVDGDARQGENVDHADIDARRDQQRNRILHAGNAQRRQHAAEGNRGEDRHRRGHDHDRRQAKQRFVDVAGGVFLFEDEFQPVGQRLAEAEHFDVRQRNADAVGPAAILHPGRHPALEQHQIRGRRHQPADEQRDFDEHEVHRTSARPKQIANMD